MASPCHPWRQGTVSILTLVWVDQRAESAYRRERDWVLGEFKSGRSPILIATDVASRGLGVYSFSRQALRQSVVVSRVCYSLDPSRLRARIRLGHRSR